MKLSQSVGPLLFALAVGCSTTDAVTPVDATAVTDAAIADDRGEVEAPVDAPPDVSFDVTPDANRSGRCTANAECAGTPERPACDTATGLCVGCLAGAADTCPGGSYCDVTRHCATGCRSDGDCAARGANLRCDATLHACVGCLRDADCRLGTLCSEGVCVDGCSVAHGCDVGATCCVSTCAALGSDPLNCGACGHACPTGQLCCEGHCANGASDALNCGACGHACDLPRATPLCVASSCSASACASGFGDCNLEAGDGCEAALGTDVEDCGACGRRCSAGPNSTAQCAGGECGLRCDAGHGDCDGNLGNGCETDLSSTPTACGSCTGVCAIPNAVPGCAAGRCVVGSCVPGYADCDGLVANGCETAVTTNTNCGACGHVCSAGSVCSGGTCNSTCAAGTTLCVGACADLANDPANCGACGHACAAPPSARATCAAGACAYACNPGYGDCDATSSNGCEADLTTSSLACGACGTACSPPANATPGCHDGTCGIGSCNAGYADCDGDATNGCEVALASAVDHCGTCAGACPAVANAVRSCAGGACGFACASGYHDCGGTCVRNTDPASCGASCAACPAVANATATCNGTSCDFGCNAGYVRSGSSCAPNGTCPAAPGYPTAGLIGAYEFELDARDASAAHNDGVVIAPVSFGSGTFCQAATFTGTGSIDLPDQRLSMVTVSMRVRYNGPGTATNYQPVVDAWSTEENYLLGIEYSAGALRYSAAFHARIDATFVQHEIHIASPSPIPIGDWHHVAMSFDGTTLRLYVDGVEQARTTTPGDSYPAPMIGPPDARVGCALRGPNYGSPVSVDHLLIYNRALSAAEIVAL